MSIGKTKACGSRFEEFLDYLTQGETLEELQENLRDLYKDVTSAEITGIRRVAELAAG